MCRSWLKWNLSQSEKNEQREKKRLGAYITNHKRGVHDETTDPECPLCPQESAGSEGVA